MFFHLSHCHFKSYLGLFVLSQHDQFSLTCLSPVTSGEALSPPADNDGGERPVRKQLMETSIEPAPTNETGNGRKRSFEEARDDVHDPNENGDSSRKRSRESTPEDSQLSDSAAGKDMTGSAHAQNVSIFEPPCPHGHKDPKDTQDPQDFKDPQHPQDPQYPQDFKDPKDPFSTITTPHPMDLTQEKSATITQEPHGVSASMEGLEEQQFLDPTSAAVESPHNQSSDEWVTTSDDESVSPMEYEETLEAGTGPQPDLTLFDEESFSSHSRSHHSSASESTGPNSDESDSDEYDFYEYDSYYEASETTASKSALDEGESESTGSHSDEYEEYDDEEYFSAEEESDSADEHSDESEEDDLEEPEEQNPDPLSATPGSPQSHISDGSVDLTPGSDEESGSASASEAQAMPMPSAGPEKVTSQAAEPSRSSALDLAEVIRRRPKMKAITPYWNRKERDFQRQKEEAERAEQAEQSQEESVDDYDGDDDTDGSSSGVEEEISTPSPTEEQASLPPSPSGADAESAYGNTPSPQDPQDTESEKNDDANNRLQETTNPAIDGASANTSSQTGGSEDEPTKAPKKKRSREQLEENAEAGLGADAQAPPRSVAADEKPATQGEPEKKRHRDNSQERETKNVRIHFPLTIPSFGDMLTFTLGVWDERIRQHVCKLPVCCPRGVRLVCFQAHHGLVEFRSSRRELWFRCPGKWILGSWEWVSGGHEAGWPDQLCVSERPGYTRHESQAPRCRGVGGRRGERQRRGGDRHVRGREDRWPFLRANQYVPFHLVHVFLNLLTNMHYSRNRRGRRRNGLRLQGQVVPLQQGVEGTWYRDLQGQRPHRGQREEDGPDDHARRRGWARDAEQPDLRGHELRKCPERGPGLEADSPGQHGRRPHHSVAAACKCPLFIHDMSCTDPSLQTGNEAYAKDAYEAIRSLLAGDKDSA